MSEVRFGNQEELRKLAAKPVAQITTAVPLTPARLEPRAAPVVQPTPVLITPNQQSGSTPLSMSVTNSGQNTMVLTSSDGNTINMGDFMSAIMMQITSVN